MTVAAGRGRKQPFLVVGAAWFAMMAGSNLATPLYAIYEREFGFSKAVLTLVFATYALVLAPSLLVFGQLSDRLGRRRVLAAGFATATVGLVLFAFASGLAWLFAARAIQGLAVGMISGAAAAALVELDPAPLEDRAALFSALAQAGGSASGPLLAGALAQWAPARLVLPFTIFAALGVLATLAALAIREPGRVVPGRLHIVRPSVPPEIRVLFARVSVTGAAVWAVAALFLSVVPSYAADLLDTSNLALLGAISALMLAASCAAQIAVRDLSAAESRPDDRHASGSAARSADSRPVRPLGAHARLQAAGLLLLAAGLLALVLAFPTRSLPVLLAAGVLAGAGHGLAFLGAQAQLNLAAPPNQRGAVNAAFYTLVYLGVAAMVITTGLLTLHFALATAVTTTATTIALVALLTSLWHLKRS